VVLVVALIAAGALLFVHLRRASQREWDEPSPPVALPEPRPPTPAAPTPEEAVVSYLDALDQAEYRTAYAYLSAASRTAHPYEKFLGLCENGEATSYDVGAAREIPGEGQQVVVLVPIVEDPAEGSFTTVHEAEGWKVVFIAGAPWFPYP
jgi:hypothetical protein